MRSKDEAKSPIEQLIDLLVYAPVGFLYEKDELLDKVVTRGRSQVQLARLMAKMAAQQGGGPEAAVNEAIGFAADVVAKSITELGVALGVVPSPRPHRSQDDTIDVDLADADAVDTADTDTADTETIDVDLADIADTGTIDVDLADTDIADTDVADIVDTETVDTETVDTADIVTDTTETPDTGMIDVDLADTDGTDTVDTAEIVTDTAETADTDTIDVDLADTAETAETDTSDTDTADTDTADTDTGTIDIDLADVEQLSIDDYDSLTARAIIAALDALTPVQIARIADYERANRGRKTVLAKAVRLST